MLGKLFPGAAWLDVEDDGAVYRYESFTYHAGAETWALIQEVEKVMGGDPLGIPVFAVASVQDNTVSTQAILDFMRAESHPVSHTLLYSQHAVPPYPNTSIYDSNAPEQGVLSLSHLGLMTPPTHPHYGRDGAYRNCDAYYGSAPDSFARCKAGMRDFYGEITPENLAAGVIERIAFNPFYDDLLEEIELFIEQVSIDRRGVPIIPEFIDVESGTRDETPRSCDPGTC